MTVGRNILRRAYPSAATPAGGAAGSAVTVSGTIVPNGAAVEWAWGRGSHTPPVDGWTAAQSTAAGNWSVAANRPATAGTWHLWARAAAFPRTAKPSGPVTVT